MAKKQARKNEHISLFDGCYCSKFKVFPSNWNDTGADPSTEWRIYYRFYDPAFKEIDKYKKGLLRVVKGMNLFRTLTDKRKVTTQLLELEHEMIVEKGYNPISKVFMASAVDTEPEFIIAPDTPFIAALNASYNRIEAVESTKSDLRSIIKGVTASAVQLRIDQIPINTVKRRHIIMIFDNLKQTNEKFSKQRHKKYRAYLQMLFNELEVIETMDYNPIDKLPVPKYVSKKKELLTNEERKKVDSFLRANHYRFWLFLQIFYHSGSRETELMKVKGQDVDIIGQRYKVTILKGKQYREEWRVIKDVAVDYWKQALVGCNKEDYVFSVGLTPGPAKIRTEQITRRWRTHVKEKLGITKDFYSLKALNSDETDEMHGLAVAAAQNSHKNTKVTAEHYAVNHETRMKEILKGVNNTFVPENG